MKSAPKSGPRLVVLDNSDPIFAETEAVQSRIRQRAFELSKTRPAEAHELYDWILAESEVISVPPAELTERDSTFEVKFAVAGINPDDVNVLVTVDQILLKSEFIHRHDSAVETVHMCDFKSGTIFRSVSLPEAIDLKSVKIDIGDGLVTVSATKRALEKPRPPRTARKAAKKTRARKP